MAQGGGLRSPGTVFFVCVCNLILTFCFSITASGFGSKYKYLFGHITMQIKLVAGNSAGTVTAYYVSNMPRARLSFCHCVFILILRRWIWFIRAGNAPSTCYCFNEMVDVSGQHYLLEDSFDTTEQICDRMSDYSVNFILLLFLLFVHSFRPTIRTMMS